MRMTLADYMKKHGLTDEQMAVKIGKDRSVISRYRRGEIIPPAEVIHSIQTATGLAVRFNDWFAGKSAA